MLQKESQYRLLAALAFFIAALFSVGYHHFDEHFQIMEFAGLKLGLNQESAMPWEYAFQIRPTLQPAMVVIFQRITSYLGLSDPFVITFLLRLVSAAFSFYILQLIYRAFKDSVKEPELQKWYLILTYTLWFTFYIGVRFSSENWSALWFLLGFALYFLNKDRDTLHFFLIGIYFGLAFLFRFQAAFMILGFGFWLLLIAKEKFKDLLTLFAGFVLVFLIGALIDRWFYDEWTVSSWNYFAQNIIEDKVSGFGIRPWYWYFTKVFESAVPPLSLLILLSYFAIVILRPKSPLVWVSLPFLLIHILIGHKELRFLFPLYLLVPVIIVKAIISVQRFFTLKVVSNSIMRITMKLCFVINFILLLVVIFKPADNQIGLYKKIYRDYKTSSTLYHIDKNPYHRVLGVNYYKRPQLKIVKAETLAQIPSAAETQLVVTENRLPESHPRIKRLVYSSFPAWLLEYNYNNWQDRTPAWYVYELR